MVETPPYTVELRTGVKISEQDKLTRENSMKEVLRKAYLECKEKTRDEGTLIGAKCICKKIEDKKFQSKLLMGK